LAWLERSIRRTVISTLFAASALPANRYNRENLFYRFGLLDSFSDERLSAVANFALPALILLIGGVVALLFRRRA
jgi:hypothetical protein